VPESYAVVKAAIQTRYGPPEVVRLAEVPRPVPGAGEVLVKVHATTLSRTDCGVRGADPFIVRFFTGLTKPRRPIRGIEFSGEVEAVGGEVTSFSEGDAVFGLSGDGEGGHAEYLCVPASGPVARKPDGVSHEQAAATCDGATGALTALRRADLQRGQRILINGASGAIGSAAVQLARHLGAEVTAVCATPNLELARSLGAGRVIDYTREDFTKDGERYDIVFDAVGKSSFRRCRRLLEPHGVFVFTDLGFLWHVPALVLLTRFAGRRRVLLPIPRPDQRDIELLRDLTEQGAFTAVIDRRYPLDSIVEAYRYVETGQKTGNVVINVGCPARP
jgi:NADPH:quinone reductase-like Zn-dependent oxidoreductase